MGRWHPYKGSRTVVEAAAHLADRGIDFSLSLLGTAVEREAVIADFPGGVRSRLSVVSAFPNDELPKLLAGAEVFVFPSLSEGSSGSLLEAMACGLAPVATAVGAAPQILDGSNGSLVEVGDATAVAAAIERFALDRGRLLDTRLRAQETTRRFRWSDIAARTIELYEGALRR